MVRKGYPFNKRNDKKMTKLVSGLLTGLLMAPLAITDTFSKNCTDVAYQKQNKKEEALFGLFLGIIFLTPLFALFVYVSIKFELINFPIIGELLFIGFWWVIISNLIEAFKNKKEDNIE